MLQINSKKDLEESDVLDYLVKEGNLYELKDAKKSQEEARLQQLKQEMRNSTDNMVSNAKIM